MAGSGRKTDLLCIHIVWILKTNGVQVENNLETKAEHAVARS